MKRILITLYVFWLLCGCSYYEPMTGVTPSPHYITDYIAPSEIEVITNENGFISLRAYGEIHKTYFKKSEEAMRLAKLYGDTSYKGSIHPGMHPALAYPIDKITIYCDSDFDVRHPAGESLDDIVRLKYSSLYDFIRGGYKLFPQEARPGAPAYTDLTRYDLCFNYISPELTKVVSVSLPDCDLGGINFVTPPDTPGEYTFTLSLTTNGETFTTTFTHTFE